MSNTIESSFILPCGPLESPVDDKGADPTSPFSLFLLPSASLLRRHMWRRTAERDEGIGISTKVPVAHGGIEEEEEKGAEESDEVDEVVAMSIASAFLPRPFLPRSAVLTTVGPEEAVAEDADEEG